MGVTGLEAKVRLLRQATGGSETTGWMNDEVCWLLFGLIRFYRPSLVIQTGHLWGKSALIACEALERRSLDGNHMGDPAFSAFVKDHSPSTKKGKMISIDPGPLGVPHPDRGVRLLQEWYPEFSFVASSSEAFFETFTTKGRVFGIVDGDHSLEGARADLLAFDKLKAGMILVDDTSWIPELAGLSGQLAGYQSIEFPNYNGVTLLTRVTK